MRAENDRQLSKGAKGNPEGFVHGGKVYIVASEMKNASDVERVLLHESLGHFGLRGLYGDKLDGILRQVSALRHADVVAKAKQYGLDMRLQKDRLIAAEEVLAELAQNNPKNTLVQRAIAAIRTWLRENVPSLFKHMEMTDAEIINNYLVPAREFVQRGRKAEAAPGGLSPAMSREEQQGFSDAVDAALDDHKTGPIQMGRTPDALLQAGLPDVPLVITGKVIDKIHFDHGLTRKKLKALPELLANPIMVFKSATTPGSFVVLADERHKGNPVTVYIKPNGEVLRIGPFNILTSAYGRESELIAKWILGGNLIASDKEKALAWISTEGIKFPSRTPEVTVAPTSNRAGRGGSILEQLKAAIRKSLPINVPEDGGNVNLSRSGQTDTPAFKEDIPNESWLNEQIDYAKERGTDRHGVPYMGKVTGRFDGPVTVPASAIANLRGERGEQDNPQKATRDALIKVMRETGKFPLQNGREYVPYIEVAHDGSAWVSEGNHRIMAAVALGWKNIPIEIKYFDGGQRNAGALSPERLATSSDPANSDIRFSRSAAAPATGAPAGAATIPFRTRMDKVVDSLIYNFQDRFKPLKDIQKRAGALPEEQDALLAEERYSGTVRARTDDFEAEHRTPLVKAIHDSKVAYEDVEDYLHALHAPSRNKAMRDINPTEAELNSQTESLTEKRETLARDVDVEEYVKARRELRLAEADIDDGLADESLGRMLKQEIAKLTKMASVRDYLDTLDKLRALRNVKPFLGDNTALSGMSNAEADEIIAKAKKQGTEKALAGISAMVDTITTETRDIFVEAGLEKAETIAAGNAKYEHYVPLHRDEVGGSSMPRIGQGFNIRGRESKRATGSNREVTNVLAHVVAQHEAAIIPAEKSRVERAQTGDLRSTAEARGYNWGYSADKKCIDNVFTAFSTLYSVAVPPPINNK